MVDGREKGGSEMESEKEKRKKCECEWCVHWPVSSGFDEEEKREKKKRVEEGHGDGKYIMSFGDKKKREEGRSLPLQGGRRETMTFMIGEK